MTKLAAVLYPKHTQTREGFFVFRAVARGPSSVVCAQSLSAEGWVPPNIFYCIASAASYMKYMELQELYFVELWLGGLSFLPLILQNPILCCFWIKDGDT